MPQAISKRPAKAASPSRVAASRPTPKRISAAQITSADIAQRAYEKYVARGGVHGHDQADWFVAEQELIAEARKT